MKSNAQSMTWIKHFCLRNLNSSYRNARHDISTESLLMSTSELKKYVGDSHGSISEYTLIYLCMDGCRSAQTKNENQTPTINTFRIKKITLEICTYLLLCAY